MKHLIYVYLFLCLYSCNTSNNENRTLNQIENMIQAYPDSALRILDSLTISSYNLYDQNRFFLYRVQAKDLTQKDIINDKEILDVYNFFLENASENHIGLASLYSGRVLHENENYEQATIYYNICLNNAKKGNDKELQGYSCMSSN